MSRGVPPVLVYCGRMFDAGCEAEADLAARIGAEIDRLGARVAFGPLACGADILIAEAILARGGTLNVVLPFAQQDFVEVSVRRGGEAWVGRFERCLAKAATTRFATRGAYVGDDNQFAYNTRYAMGLASLSVRESGGKAVQLAIVSHDVSNSRTGLAGTNADIKLWQSLGGETVRVATGPVTRNCFGSADESGLKHGLRREIRSILFADYKGFSWLGERELPVFMHEVMGSIGKVLNRFGDHVEFRNTWGDAIYAIVDTPTVAAQIALELQKALQDLPAELRPQVPREVVNDWEAGREPGMRLGLHFGPVWVGTDRITGNRIYYGGEVNLTARIEPVTPVGGVYCTETFAAALEIDNCPDCVMEYLGPKSLAKSFGEVVLYELKAACGMESLA